MQDFLVKMLWDNEDIPKQADQLCREMPGFAAEERAFRETAQQIEDLVGYALFDRFQTQLLRYTGYEIRAYYALGLGLRESLFQALEQ